MAIVIPIPEMLALHALRLAAVKVLDLLLAHLTRSSSQARHRATSPWEIRLRQWKTLLADGPARLPDPEPAPDPVPPPPTTFDTPSAETWHPFHPPPRSAQPDLDPSVEHLIPSIDDTIEWPPTDHLPPPPYPDVRTDRPDPGFAGYFPESAFVDTVVLDPVLPDPVVPEPALLCPLAPDLDVLDPVVPGPDDLGPAGLYLDPTVLESAIQEAAVLQPDAPQATDLDTTSWEFTPGDLTKWWDEAYARLDAAVADHRRQLYGSEWDSPGSCDTGEIVAAG